MSDVTKTHPPVRETLLFHEESVWKKLANVSQQVHEVLQYAGKKQWDIPDFVARDIPVVHAKQMPVKKGLSTPHGLARMLHDLASIELQAMELGLRSLVEYPEAPELLRQELADLTLSEAEHLRICLEGIHGLGFQWGDWPVHQGLWQSVRSQDSLLDRLLIVHRYLEGSGLDAGETLLRRLEGLSTADGGSLMIVQQIVREEIPHVRFGSYWYQQLCRQEGKDPDQDFASRMLNLRHQLPKRIENLSLTLRRQAGFTDSELQFLQEYRQGMIKFQAGV
jgi:uncharacterized ferritin-like protein (DUF455 family)